MLLTQHDFINVAAWSPVGTRTAYSETKCEHTGYKVDSVIKRHRSLHAAPTKRVTYNHRPMPQAHTSQSSRIRPCMSGNLGALSSVVG